MVITLASLLLVTRVFIIFFTFVVVVVMKEYFFFVCFHSSDFCLHLCSEGHPDTIGPDGVASNESYQSDLLYLKKKVSLMCISCNALSYTLRDQNIKILINS